MRINEYTIHKKALLAVDCVIFGFNGSGLQILLMKRDFEPEKNKWSLMGGFVQENEETDEAVIRVLNRLIGHSNFYFEQLYAFAHPDRDPMFSTLRLIKEILVVK